jgi:hypothetical protein
LHCAINVATFPSVNNRNPAIFPLETDWPDRRLSWDVLETAPGDVHFADLQTEFPMRISPRGITLAAALVAGAACTGASQEPLAIGAVAPGFSLTGATREGVLASPVRLEDLRDKTVVIAFFYQAKTKG